MKEYISKPFHEKNINLEGGFKLVLKWNIFQDKKNDDIFVMRVRYVLYDKNENRSSLKVLDLNKPVTFREIEMSDLLTRRVFSYMPEEDKETIINTYFEKWLRSDFIEMINSGKFKII